MESVAQSPAAVAGPPVAQPVLTPLTVSAVILVLTIDDDGDAVVHDLLADLSGLARTVGFRSPEGLAVVAGHRIGGVGSPLRRASARRAASVPGPRRRSAPGRGHPG